MAKCYSKEELEKLIAEFPYDELFVDTFNEVESAFECAEHTLADMRKDKKRFPSIAVRNDDTSSLVVSIANMHLRQYNEQRRLVTEWLLRGAIDENDI